MFKIHLTDPTYFAKVEQLKRRLNTENVLYLSKKEIKKIGRYVDKDIFYIYKRNLLFEYFDDKREIDSLFINRVNKLIKKLNIELELYEYKYLNEILKEEFAQRRAKKSLETDVEFPKYLSDKSPFFRAKNVVLFEKNKYGLWTRINNFDVYWFNKNIVFTKNSKTVLTFNKKEILNTNKSKIGFEFETELHSHLMLYQDGNILDIYFKRF